MEDKELQKKFETIERQLRAINDNAIQQAENISSHFRELEANLIKELAHIKKLTILSETPTWTFDALVKAISDKIDLTKMETLAELKEKN